MSRILPPPTKPLAVKKPKKKRELECKIEDRIVKGAGKRGWRSRKMNGLGNNSWPDRMLIHQAGVIAFLEVKKVGEEPTKAQEDLLQDLRDRGCNASWFDDSEEAISWLASLES